MLQKRLLAIFGVVALVAAACGGTTATASPQSLAPGETPGPTPSGEPPAGEQVIRLYLSSDDPATLDPNAAQDSVSLAVLGSIVRPLLWWDKDLKVVPSLAEDYEVTNNGQTFTFTLRDGAKYSDGSDIVAGDLVFGWKRLVDPRLANPYAYVMCPVEGADAVLGAGNGCGTADTPTEDAAVEAALDGFGVSAPDDKTFVVELAQPATYFASIAAMWITAPIKEEWVNTPNFTEADNYVGSGPFMLQSWTHNSEIVLVPNPNWYGDAPKLSEVRYQIGGDPSAALAAYERGDLDMIYVTTGSDIRRVGDDPQFEDQLRDVPQFAITYYGYATCQQPPTACPSYPDLPDGKAPTANTNFRIALTQAVNKQNFIDLTFGGTGAIANSMVMPGIPGSDEEYDPYPYDPAAAQDRMATALEELEVTDKDGDGEVTFKDLGTISIGYNVDAGHLPRVAFLAEAWRTTFGATEAQFDFVGTDFPTFLQERHAGKYVVTRNGWGADFPHAHNQLSDLFRCGGGNNEEQYCNTEFDQLIDEAAQEPDQDRQIELYIEAQRIMLDDAPIIPLRFGVGRYLVQPYVQGVQPTGNDYQNTGDNFMETISLAAH